MAIGSSTSQSHQRDVSQLKEICGVSDDEAQKAYKESGFNVGKAIEILKAKRQAADGRNMQVVPVNGVSRTLGISDGRGDLIDLTTEEDQIQKAIALSLEHAPGTVRSAISQEDEEISRALEESLAANREMARRGRINSWMLFTDPLNPHERTRQGDTPVGLKNVGNTCWFSAVIQSLFHLPIVRRHILSYKMPLGSTSLSDSPQCDQTHEQQTPNQILNFMYELRVLCSLLVQSKRKYVNPSKPVEILKSAFATSSSQFSFQQDVSEFNHKLLEWLQEAFALQQVEGQSESSEAEGSETEKEEENPVVKLFYGKCRTEGVNEGNRFTNESSFTSFPVQVRGHHDLHSCLEASLVQRDIEPVSSSETTSLKAEQETWFTRLPPILSIELSRFEFNQSEQKAEKIHDRLTFPQIIYMDRYLECNKVDVSARRETVYKLRHKLDILERQLDKFTNYKSKRVPLQDVFDLAVGFAQTKRMRSDNSEREDDIMETSPQDIKSASGQNAVVEPCPRHVTDEELRTLHTCLMRWKREVKEDQQGLQEDIEEVTTQINEMYNESNLMQVSYQLYAVLVHEGEAAGGHYWAYINPPSTLKWLKFNDIAVCEVTWEEVERESMGDHRMASAYCLIYLDQSQKEWINCDEEPFNLPSDLQVVVDEDNEKLEKEIQDYDEKQQRSEAVPLSETSHLGPRPGAIGEEREQAESVVNSAGFPRVLEEPQAAVAEGISRDMAVEIQQLMNPLTIDTVVSELCIEQQKALMAKYRKLTEDQSAVNDTRLVHLCCYMVVSQAPQGVMDAAISEEVLQRLPLDSFPKGSHHAIQNAAYRKMRSLGSDDDRAELQRWKVYYKRFCSAVGNFVAGLEHITMGSNLSALPYLLKAWELNSHLMFPGSQASHIDETMLTHARHHCIRRVNEEVLQLFTSPAADNIGRAMQLIHQLIIPSLAKLEDSSLQSDHAVKAEVTEAWCTLLSGDNLGVTRQERLQDVLEKMFDVSLFASAIQEPCVPTELMSDLLQRYREIVVKLQ